MTKKYKLELVGQFEQKYLQLWEIIMDKWSQLNNRNINLIYLNFMDQL